MRFSFKTPKNRERKTRKHKKRQLTTIDKQSRPTNKQTKQMIDCFGVGLLMLSVVGRLYAPLVGISIKSVACNRLMNANLKPIVRLLTTNTKTNSKVKKTLTKKEILAEKKRKLEAQQLPPLPQVIDTEGQRLEVSLIVERAPLCPPMVESWENDFFLHRLKRHNQMAIDFAQFDPSNKDKKKTTKKKDNKQKTQAETSPIQISETSEALDEAQTQDNDYPVGSLITEADKSGDRTTLYRALTQRLFLIVRSADTDWHFPTRRWQQQETLRATAERALRLLGKRAELQVIGNAPIGHLQIPFEAPTDGYVGRKV